MGWDGRCGEGLEGKRARPIPFSLPPGMKFRAAGRGAMLSCLLLTRQVTNWLAAHQLHGSCCSLVTPM